MGESLNSAGASGELQQLDVVDILLMLLRLSDVIGSPDGCIPLGSIGSKPMPPPKADSGGDTKVVSMGGVGDMPVEVPPRQGKPSDGSNPVVMGLAGAMSGRKTLSDSLPGCEILSGSAPLNRYGS
jgi:hypothetical protein